MNLVNLLREAGLTGRGGAAFSTAIKLESALAHRARLIVNVCDGEIGAAKDTWVVANHLDEVVSAARLISADEPLFAAHRGSVAALTVAAAGLRLLNVPHRYVSSEESSLISLANGGLARPMTKRQPVSLGGRDQNGRRFAPTLVLNAETVWRVSQIIANGPQWFRSFGDGDQPGPRLASVGVAGRQPMVLATAAGARLVDLLMAAGLDTDCAAINVGGLSGGWLRPQEAQSVLWRDDSLGRYGLKLGAGIIRVLPTGSCPWTEVATLTRYAAGESAGQCGPCMFGLPAVADDLEAVVAGDADANLPRLRQRLGLLPGRGACHHPDGVAGFVASAIRAFGDDLEAHQHGGCAHTVPHPSGGRHELIGV